MSIIAKIKAKLISLLGGLPRNAYNEVDILFYKDCRHAGHHGMVVVSHKKLRLQHVAVPFLFPDLATPPVLTARLMRDIQSAAESQGYIFHHLVAQSYGVVDDVDLSGGQEATDEWDDLSQVGSHYAFDQRNLEHRIPAVNRRTTVSQRSPIVERRESLGRAARETLGEYSQEERQHAARTHAGVSHSDIETYLARWWSENNTRIAVRASLTIDQNQAVSEMIEARVAHGFMKRDKVGVIDHDLDEILNTYLKGIGRTVQSVSGKHLMGVQSKLPIPFSKLKEGSTLEQIQEMERTVEQFFPRGEYDALTQQLQEEIQTRVLMSINNDTARQKEPAVIRTNAQQIIDEFRQVHVPGAGSLKFTRQNTQS